MNIGKYIFGVREEYFVKVDEKTTLRQFFVFNNLTLMFFVLVGCIVLSGVVFGLLIFNSWWLSIVIGIILGAITFTLLLLVFFLNMTTNHQELYLTMTEMEPVFETYEKQEIEHWSDEQILNEVETYKDFLRDTNRVPSFDHFHFSSVITSTIKVILILIISCVVANAMEFLFFQKTLNESLTKIKNDKTLATTANCKFSNNPTINEKIAYARWTREMLNEDPNNPFVFIKCKSFLLSMEILEMSLGKWKILLDLLFAALFLTPFILLKKSREYAGGDFLKESALVDISHSLMIYLLAERERRRIKKEIESNYDYNHLLLNQNHGKEVL